MKNKITAYLNPIIDEHTRKLAKTREQTLSELVSCILENEIAKALQAGEIEK